LKKFLVLGGAVFGVVLLTFVLRGGSPSPEAMCEQAFKEQYGEQFQGFVVKEKIWNRISYDLNGYYNNGEWACALSNNPIEFRGGILFPRDAGSESFSKTDIG
jgi:hypothetical protein